MILRRVHRKQNEDKIVFLKSWNEWAEGNYMEPDTRWGKGYIQALKELWNGICWVVKQCCELHEIFVAVRNIDQINYF